MNRLGISGIVVLASMGSAAAADPIGEWVVKDGVARIRIVDCNTRLWGVVSWEKTPGGLDAENPDRSKRSRPTLGMPILLNMKKAPPEKAGEAEEWEGKVYNAKNGKTYDAKIKPVAQDRLEIKGCVLGFLCGGETWTRYIDPASPVSPAPAAAPKMTSPGKGKVPAKAAPVAAPATAATTAEPNANPEICSLPEIAGAPH